MSAQSILRIKMWFLVRAPIVKGTPMLAVLSVRATDSWRPHATSKVIQTAVTEKAAPSYWARQNLRSSKQFMKVTGKETCATGQENRVSSQHPSLNNIKFSRATRWLRLNIKVTGRLINSTVSANCAPSFHQVSTVGEARILLLAKTR
jgi:hypothetical protein